jgi:hypothetical protein
LIAHFPERFPSRAECLQLVFKRLRF